MSDKRYILPRRAQLAFLEAMPEGWRSVDPYGYILAPAFEALARSLAERPIVPTDAQIGELISFAAANYAGNYSQLRYELVEWQRRMFQAPEPEVPEEIKNLLTLGHDPTLRTTIFDYNERILTAYRRGQKSRTSG